MEKFDKKSWTSPEIVKLSIKNLTTSGGVSNQKENTGNASQTGKSIS